MDNSTTKKLGWFVIIWLASVTTLTVVAYAIKLLI
jgi:uncharacterized protein DUF2474